MSNLPISKPQAIRAIAWMRDHFGAEIRSAVFGPFTENHIYGIACQETAYFWLQFIDRHPPEEILARCVLDASGDIAGHPRSAFPRNTLEFRKKYGPTFTDLLIDEANKTRKLRGLSPAQIVYKGYGIFQYDLQFVARDEGFFRHLGWHDFRQCLDRCIGELRAAYARHGDVWKTLKVYNGSGAAATKYADNVSQFAEWAK